MGEKVNKTWFKDKFTLTTIIWHKAHKLLYQKCSFLVKHILYPFFSYSLMQEEKGWEETGGTQELLILLNFSEATYD